MPLKPLHDKTDYFRFAILCTWGDEDNVPLTPEQGNALVVKTLNDGHAQFFQTIEFLKKRMEIWRTLAIIYVAMFLLHIAGDMAGLLK